MAWDPLDPVAGHRRWPCFSVAAGAEATQLRAAHSRHSHVAGWESKDKAAAIRRTGCLLVGCGRREQTAYVGDDLNDLVCGITLACCSHPGRRTRLRSAGRADLVLPEPAAMRHPRFWLRRSLLRRGRMEALLSQGLDGPQWLKLRRKDAQWWLRGLDGGSKPNHRSQQAGWAAYAAWCIRPSTASPSSRVCADLLGGRTFCLSHGLPAFHTRRGRVMREKFLAPTTATHPAEAAWRTAPDAAPCPCCLAWPQGVTGGRVSRLLKPWSKGPSFAWDR